MIEETNGCPLCGSDDIEIKIAPVTFEWGTRGTTVINNCKEIVCNYCKECFFTKETSSKIEKSIREYLKEGNYGSNEI